MAIDTAVALMTGIVLYFNYLFWFRHNEHRNYWICGFANILIGAVLFTYDQSNYFSWIIILTGFGLILSPKSWRIS